MTSKGCNFADRFKNKRIIVTGASSGIGKATAIAFASRGANVLLIARRKNVLDEIVAKDMGGKGHALAADLSDLAKVTSAIQEAAKILGGIDVLVNNVGGPTEGALQKASYAKQLPSLLQFNLISTETAIEAALPFLLESKGSIVNVGSISGIVPITSIAAYATAKAALHYSTQVRASLLARRGINVNCVAPATTTTDIFAPMAQAGMNMDKFYQDSGKLHLDGRVGTAEEVAEAIVFLSDKQASGHVTGLILPVDGGAHIDAVLNLPNQRPVGKAQPKAKL